MEKSGLRVLNKASIIYCAQILLTAIIMPVIVPLAPLFKRAK